MNELKELYTIDFLSVFLSVVIILTGLKIICGTPASDKYFQPDGTAGETTQNRYGTFDQSQ